MTGQPLGPILHSYFLDHLIAVKGLRPDRSAATATRSGCCSCSSPPTSAAR